MDSEMKARQIAVDWLLELVDHEMVHDLGVVATPLDHLTPDQERDAVLWVRSQAQQLAARLDDDRTDA